MFGAHDTTADLTSCPTEFEAETIAAALREQGIPAQVIGGLLTGMRAEAPVAAKVIVRTKDLDRARGSLRALKAESVDIDWDEVDVGKPEPDAPALPEVRCPRCSSPVGDKPTCPACGAVVSRNAQGIDPTRVPPPASSGWRPGVWLIGVIVILLALIIVKLVSHSINGGSWP